MIASEGYLRTQQLADALGVSVSTIKRWVDGGTIQAIRTVGKHRLIPLQECLRLANELGTDATKLLRLVREHEGDLPQSSVIDDRTCELLAKHLCEGRVQAAKSIIHAFAASGCGAVSLGDDLIRPVMQKIGHSWMVGSIDVYQEHQATHIVASSLIELIGRLSKSDRAKGAPLALGATAEGDPYILSTLLGELVLREQGWDVKNLGVNLPLSSLINAVLEFRPKLVFLSINYLRDEHHFVREYASFYEVASDVNTAVILGGHALGPELRSRLKYAAFGDRMIHLAEFARRLWAGAANSASNSVSSDRSRQAMSG
jgi:excisionase family DNA binding protein